MTETKPGKPLNEALLKSDFSDMGFAVKELKFLEDVCVFEWNYPDEEKAFALRDALLKCGASVVTKYKRMELADNNSTVLHRDSAEIAYSSHEDLRKFFNDAMDHFLYLTDGKNGPLRGQPGTPKPTAMGSKTRRISSF